MPEPQRPYTKPLPVFLDTYPHPTSAENADAGENEYGDILRAERRRVAEQLRNIYAHKAIAFK